MLRYHLKGLSIPLVNWVIFSNRSLLYVPVIDQHDTFVIQHSDMNYMMKAYLDTRPDRISENTLNNLENLLVNLNQANDLNMKKHIEGFQ